MRLPASWGGGSPTCWPSRVDTNLIVGCAVSNLRLRGRLVGLGAFSFARRTAPYWLVVGGRCKGRMMISRPSGQDRWVGRPWI